MARQFDYDPVSGMETLFHYDDRTDNVILEYRQHNLPQIIDRAKKLKSNTRRQSRQKKEGMMHVGTIPNWLAMKWLVEEGWDCFDKENIKRVLKKLESPEYKWLKTFDGRIA